MRSKKHLVLITLTLLLGAFVATAKPPHGGWKGENPCQGFFEAPFLSLLNATQPFSSEGKLCYWEGNTSIVHATVKIEGVPEGKLWCIFLADGFDFFRFAVGHTATNAPALGSDLDGNDEIFLDRDICTNGCENGTNLEPLSGGWAQPAFWVTEVPSAKACEDGGEFLAFFEQLRYLSGFALPDPQ